MEEKIIIKGEPFIGAKIIFIAWLLCIILLGIFMGGIILSSFLGGSTQNIEDVVLILFVLLGLLVIFTILKMLIGRSTITVTDKRVYGTSVFGRRVDLPMDSVSSISKAWFNGIFVSTSSGVIKFYGIKNVNALYEEIGKLLLERQNKDDKVIAIESNGVTEELRKYKALLDDEIITKKEFEEKKKELLKK